MSIITVGDLRKALEQFKDEDLVVVEIHEGRRSEDLYEFSVDAVHGIIGQDGIERSEVRLSI